MRGANMRVEGVGIILVGVGVVHVVVCGGIGTC